MGDLSLFAIYRVRPLFSLIRFKIACVDILLPGVGDLYTDPHIHTIDGRGMGLGNNGAKGIQRWVASHRCNAICRQLKLPQVGADAKPGKDANL